MQLENDELICIDSIGKVPTRWDFNELITLRRESLIRQVKVISDWQEIRDTLVNFVEKTNRLTGNKQHTGQIQKKQ